MYLQHTNKNNNINYRIEKNQVHSHENEKKLSLCWGRRNVPSHQSGANTSMLGRDYDQSNMDEPISTKRKKKKEYVTHTVCNSFIKACRIQNMRIKKKTKTHRNGNKK